MKKFLLTLGLGLTLMAQADAANFRIAVFVPGVLAGSPIYELMVAGVRKAAAELKTITVRTVEGGFNQAQWQDQVAQLAASGEYDLIVTSNPSLPEICDRVSHDFPQQKFLVMEGYRAGNPNLATFFYNHRELGYLHGYLAGLLAGSGAKVGLIVGQEYPVMNNAIRPGIEEGLKAQNPRGTLEFRVVGNWYDAGKAAELADSLFHAGVEVVIPIAGGANQGVLTSAQQNRKKVLWYDNSGYGLSESVVGSGAIRQDLAVYKLVKQAVAGTLVYGQPQVVGVKDGFLDYLVDDPLFKARIPASVRAAFLQVLERFKSGALSLPPALK